MSFDLGMHWSLDDAESRVDPLILSTAADIPVGKNEGTIWSRLAIYPKTVDNFEFDIFDRSVTSISGVIGNGAGTGWVDDTDTTDLPMTAAAINVLTVGHILEVGSEQVIVKAVDRSANTIDVVARGHGSTSGAAHVDGVAFSVVGAAINPDQLKNVEGFSELTGKFSNYCQRVVAVLDQEFDDEIQARKAIEQNPQLLMEAMNRVAKQCYSLSIKGVKSMKTKTSPYTTAGILEQLATAGGQRPALRQNAAAYTSLTSLFEDALEAVWRAGGNPNAILLSPANKRLLNPLMQQFKVGNTAQKSGVIGTDAASTFFYDSSELELISDAGMPDDRIEIVTLEKLYKGWRAKDALRGPNLEPAGSSLEKRYSIYGSTFIAVEGVGVNHIDCYGVNLVA
jgi:hypothetical protein